jgi:hypothetical protein
MSSGERARWLFHVDGGIVENKNVVVMRIIFLRMFIVPSTCHSMSSLVEYPSQFALGRNST